MEKKHKGRTESVVQPEVTWSANLQQDIVKAETEVLKTMKEMGMIPAGRKTNSRLLHLLYIISIMAALCPTGGNKD